MGEYSEAFVACDGAATKHAAAMAYGGRCGKIRFIGDVASSPPTGARLIGKLAGRYKKLHFCYEARPTGCGLRQIRELGHDCVVVAPSLIPKRAGERVKTNRRDAVTLARSLCAGELTAVWVPDAIHEAVRDLVRARDAAAPDLRRKRSNCCRFCCGTGALSTAASIGPWLIAAGWPIRSSNTRRNRLSVRMGSTRPRMPLPACGAASTAGCDRPALVDGTRSGSLPGNAARLVLGCGDLRGRDR
jgi:transposase